MRVIFFGSGAFGVPTLTWLHSSHEIVQVVSQPDRPAGRGRTPTPTPVTAFAREHNLPIVTVEDVATPEFLGQLAGTDASAAIVIAFGQKLPAALLEQRFTCNLHASLLPQYRGAAPINRSIMAQEEQTGLSVIALAQRIDAGEIYHQVACPLDPTRTAGEVHDMLAAQGPAAVETVIDAFEKGALHGRPQDERLATHAQKLTRADGRITFDADAKEIRAHVHGVTPWPGAQIQLGNRVCKLGRVEVVAENEVGLAAGQLRSDQAIQCSSGAVRPLEIQPAGSRMMSYASFCNGTALTTGEQCIVN